VVNTSFNNKIHIQPNHERGYIYDNVILSEMEWVHFQSYMVYNFTIKLMKFEYMLVNRMKIDDFLLQKHILMIYLSKYPFAEMQVIWNSLYILVISVICFY